MAKKAGFDRNILFLGISALIVIIVLAVGMYLGFGGTAGTGDYEEKGLLSMTMVKCLATKKCSDGTTVNLCSGTPPLFCNSVCALVVRTPNPCPCLSGTFLSYDGKSCVVYRCSDHTLFNECSVNKPLLCVNYGARLEPRASKCGCPAGYTISGENCIAPTPTPTPEALLKKLVVTVMDHSVPVVISVAALGTACPPAWSTLHATGSDGKTTFSAGSTSGSSFTCTVWVYGDNWASLNASVSGVTGTPAYLTINRP